MKKIRFFVFFFFAVILFYACKSVPAAPPDDPPSLETVPFEEAVLTEKAVSPEETMFPEETIFPEEEMPFEETAPSEEAAPSLPPVQAEQSPKNDVTDEETAIPEKPKPVLSLKPTTLLDAEKFAAPKKNAEKVPLSRLRLKPASALHSETAADASVAAPEDSQNSAVQSPSEPEFQVLGTAEVQNKPEPKTADKPERIQNTAEPEILLNTDDEAAAENNGEDNQDETSVEPSRVEEAELNRNFNILYEGKNWIFLGEKNPTRPPVVGFVKRSFSGNNTVFSLNALSEGETVLHFYKHDLLENTARDEYVLVRVKAVKTQTDAESVSTSVPETQTVSNVPLPDSDVQAESAFLPEEVYARAETAFNESRYADALNILDDFFQNFIPSDNCFDKAVFLQARIYETPSDYRNIRGALDEYKKITAFFPESDLWDEAGRRITYINRFYMDIR